MLTALLNFLIVAVVLFVIIRAYNRSRRPELEAEAEAELDAEQVVLLREIRDLLRSAEQGSGTPGPPTGTPRHPTGGSGSTAP